MLIILGLILIGLIVIVGGDRGVVSLIALVGNLLLLSFAIWLMQQEYRFYLLRLEQES